MGYAQQCPLRFVLRFAKFYRLYADDQAKDDLPTLQYRCERLDRGPVPVARDFTPGSRLYGELDTFPEIASV